MSLTFNQLSFGGPYNNNPNYENFVTGIKSSLSTPLPPQSPSNTEFTGLTSTKGSLFVEEILDLLIPERKSPIPQNVPCANESPQRSLSPKLEWDDFLKKFEELAEQDESRALEFANNQVLKTSGQELVYLYQHLAKFTAKIKRYDEARHYYHMLCFYEPKKVTNWIEFFRIEFSRGYYDRALQIVERGLTYFPMSPELLELNVVCLSQLERLADIRNIVDRIVSNEIGKYTKVLLLAAKEEAKAGNCERAREIFQNLIDSKMYCVNTSTEIMLQETHWLEFERAFKVFNMFMQNYFLKKFPHLWENALYIYGVIGQLAGTQQIDYKEVAEHALKYIEHSSHSRIYFACAEIEMYNRNFKACRFLFSMIYKTAPKELLPKYLREELLMELFSGNVEKARQLLDELHHIVQQKKTKGAFSFLIDTALVEDFFGNTDLALQILNDAILSNKFSAKEIKHLYILKLKIYIRNARMAEGLNEAEVTYKKYPETCYLLIQLRTLNGLDSSQLFFQQLPNNPRSGEHWCEGARLSMNPFSPHFDLDRAERYLEKALYHTSQDGDIWVEMLRLMIIKYGPNVDTQSLEMRCAVQRPMFGMLWAFCGAMKFELPVSILRNAKEMLVVEIEQHRSLYNAAMNKKVLRETGEVSSSDFIAALPSYCRALKNGLANINDRVLQFQIIFHNNSSKA